ncbi:class II aldolase/adducin family protein [Microbacterium sp. 2MCAF23]|uniref:class II aldolase/adducin family protein n=1 Tax=Microbacterium sp. 2MCAF23 TaxID=3232985 RepID=UPI003F963462
MMLSRTQTAGAPVRLAQELGRPDREWAILAEGNCSEAIDDARAWVKVSGTFMATATEGDFVGVDVDELLEIIDDPRSGDDAVASVFDRIAAANDGRRPSVEALLHAVCLRQDGVRSVAHTHPTPVNAVLCSAGASLIAEGSLFPDQIVVLGPRPLFVPYTDPGLALARRVRAMLAQRVDDVPRAVYLQNHGMFALGATADEVIRVTEMADKVARILLGAASFGGHRFLSDADVVRIDSRPDERHRRAALSAMKGPEVLPLGPSEGRR